MSIPIRLRHRTRQAQCPIGVTPQMVEDVVRRSFEMSRGADSPDWGEFVKRARKHPRLWWQFFGEDAFSTFEEFGIDAPKVRAVMDVARVIFAPPAESIREPTE